MIRKVKLSDTQAKVIGGARFQTVNGRSAWRVDNPRHANRATYRKLYDLGLTDAAHEFAQLTADGLSARMTLVSDPSVRVMWVGEQEASATAEAAPASVREDYETYARWAVGPVMTREQYERKGAAIQQQAAAGTLPTSPYEWGKDMDAIKAGLHTSDTTSDAMAETAPEDAPYGPWDASVADRETTERAMYHDDGYPLRTGRTAGDGYDFPVTVTRKEPATVWRMVDTQTSAIVEPGPRKSFRGEMWELLRISRYPEGNSTGRVQVVDERGYMGEFFPSVVGVKIVQVPVITPDDAGCWLQGSYGWHNNYRVIDRAEEYGFTVPRDYVEALLRYRVGIDVEDSDHEAITGQGELSDMATAYLQALAPEGYEFVWDAGELSLMVESDEI